MNSFQHLRPEYTQMNFGIPGTLSVKFGIFVCQTIIVQLIFYHPIVI